MGRKPNALILTHFERGPKLTDSSNRYQHTCKACGEKFPKGRIDSLTTHLVKKCPAISLRDRQKALLELNNLPDLGESSRNRNGDVPMNGPTVELPIGTRGWTALETLAEVSRQIDQGEKQGGHPDRNGENAAASDTRRSGKLELQEQYTLENPPLSYEQRGQKKGINNKAGQGNMDGSLMPTNFADHVDISRSTSPTLAMAATSIAAAAAAHFIPSMVDPALLADDSSHQNHLPEAKPMMQDIDDANAAMSENFFNAPQEQQASWQLVDVTYPDQDPHQQAGVNSDPQTSNSFPRLAMSTEMTHPHTEFSTEFGNGQKGIKPKVRGRFTATRRKEVQAVRKKGACIRCRMLKKPCSGDDPCSTCRGVDSARVWKHPCIRTRMAEELTMYSAGLHAVLSHHGVSAAKGRVTFIRSPHQIEASHYPEIGIQASLDALLGETAPAVSNIDPGLSGDFSTTTLRIFDYEKDNLPEKLEAYMKRMSSVFFSREPSHFMNVTLNTAQELSIEKQDALLARVLELWSTVHILVDHELHWTISERVNVESLPGHGPIIDQNTNDETYALLCLQLNASAEKKAAVICKNVLNDLERRLLQRSSTASFETFLAAIILLNCMEKSTWLFKSWEQDSFKGRWPLDKEPNHYASQGDRITGMLHMLLKIRGVPPKTFVREDGILSTKVEAAQDFFAKLDLRHAEVLHQQDNHVFDHANSRCYELRFCSRLLLPDS